MIQSSPRKLPNGLVLPCPPLPENQLVKLSTRNEKHVHHEDGRQQELSVLTQLLGLLPWQSYTRYIQNRPLATAVLTWYILQAPVPRSAGPAGWPPLQHRQGWEGSPGPSQWRSRAGRNLAGTSSSWLAHRLILNPLYISRQHRNTWCQVRMKIFLVNIKQLDTTIALHSGKLRQVMDSELARANILLFTA